MLTQNELNFIQEALSLKCDSVLKTIVDNHNYVMEASKKAEEEKANEKTKKGEKK